MIDKVIITYVDSPRRNTCFLTCAHYTALGLNSKSPNIALTFGSFSIQLKKYCRNKNLDIFHLYLSSDLENRLNIPSNTMLQIKKANTHSLELGPLIGVFISQEKFNQVKNGKSNSIFELFASTCKKLFGICCFFSMENIDWNSMNVKVFFKHDTEWLFSTLPLPKIIYDQNGDINCRTQSIELRKRLDKEYHIINAVPKLGKWETIKALGSNPLLAKIIPKTIRYTSKDDILTYLQTYPSLYLKPDCLSKGRGIYKINKVSNDLFKIEYRTIEQNHIVNLRNLDYLDNLFSQYKEQGGGYLIQQEIEKASYKGNPFDMRLLYQKDYTGTWKSSGIAVRIAAPRSIITSPRSGGIVRDFSTVIKEVFNEDILVKNGLYENILAFGKEVCTAIDKNFGDCVELGLDIAVDINKKIWLIEVNGKPLKVSLKRLKDHKIVSCYTRRPIEYAVLLTGFNSSDTG